MNIEQTQQSKVTLTAENSLQFLSQPEDEQQRLITLFARLCSSKANPPYAPHHRTVIRTKTLLVQLCVKKYITNENSEINLLGFFLSLSLIAPGFEKHSPSDLS